MIFNDELLHIISYYYFVTNCCCSNTNYYCSNTNYYCLISNYYYFITNNNYFITITILSLIIIPLLLIITYFYNFFSVSLLLYYYLFTEVVFSEDLLQELSQLDGVTVGDVSSGAIQPHSTVNLQLVWKPTLIGHTTANFAITFDDPHSPKV